MPNNIEFEVDATIGAWSYGDRSYESGETHKVSASKELAGAIAAAASAGVLHLDGSKELIADHVEDDEISLEVQENLSDEQREEIDAVAKLTAEHDFNCNLALGAYLDKQRIDEETLDAIQNESGERLTAAIAQVAVDEDLRKLLAGNSHRTLVPAIDAARELMGREAYQAAIPPPEPEEDES